jgi:hypothetical protein
VSDQYTGSHSILEGMGEMQQEETTAGSEYFPLTGWDRTEGSKARLVRGVCLVFLVERDKPAPCRALGHG